MQRRVRAALIVGSALFIGYLGCAKDAGDPALLNRIASPPNGDGDGDDPMDASIGSSGNGGVGGGAGGMTSEGPGTGGTSVAGTAGSPGTAGSSDAGDPCGGCDDGSECTEDFCGPNATCMHIAVDNDTPCATDDNGCTNDVCIGGFCTHQALAGCECSQASECDDGNPCTDDDCVMSQCEYSNNTDECIDDGNECTDDVCAAGACTHPNNTADCTDDGNECTDDVCALGSCTHPNNTDDCTDDGNECTDDVCAAGACTHPDNTAPCATDNNPCTDDVCAGGSCYAFNTAPCASDNDPCTDDVCAGGSCYAHNTAPCAPDAFECTDDICSGGTCTHPNRTGACTSDGVECTDDVCNAGVCTHPVSANTVACTTDNDPCTSDHCDGAVASCVHTPIACGTPFTINSFNGGWNTLTKPDDHTMVTAGTAGNTNPEGGTIIYLAITNNTYTISMSITQPANPQNLNGLSNIVLSIGATAGSEGMVRVGLSSSTTVGDSSPAAWNEVALAAPLYGAAFTGTSVGTPGYKTFTIPLADFGAASLAAVTQVRVQFVVTGGQKEFRFDNIAAN